jgi:hypothetical protein
MPPSSRAAQGRPDRSGDSKWERGEKRPNGPSSKLLNLVKQKRLQEIA